MASVKKQPNGRYLVRYWTDDGQQRKRRFDRMKEAKDFASAVETDKARGVFVDPREGRINSTNTQIMCSLHGSTFALRPGRVTSLISAIM